MSLITLIWENILDNYNIGFIKKKVRGDDSFVNFLMEWKTLDNKYIFDLDKLDKIMEVSINVPYELGFTASDKNLMSTRSCSYLQKNFTCGYLTPNRRTQLNSSERKNTLNRNEIARTVFEKFRLEVERGMDEFIAYELLLRIILIIWPLRINDRKKGVSYFSILPYLFIFMQVSKGGFGMPVNPRLIVFPNSYLYTIFWSRDRMYRKNKLEYVMRKYASIYNPEGNLINEIVNNIVKGDFEVVNVKNNPHNLKVSNDFTELRQYLDQNKSKLSKEGESELVRMGFKIPSDMIYYKVEERAIKRSFSSTSTTIRTKKEMNESDHRRIFKLLKSARPIARGIQESLIDTILDIEYEEIILQSKPVIVEGCGDQIYKMALFLGQTTGDKERSLFDLRIIKNILYKGGSPKSTSVETLLPYLMNPEILSNDSKMQALLLAIGVDSSVQGDLTTELRRHALLYYMILEQASSFSVMSENLSFIDFSKEAVLEKIRVEGDILFTTIMGMLGLFITVVKDFKCKPSFSFDIKLVDSLLNQT